MFALIEGWGVEGGLWAGVGEPGGGAVVVVDEGTTPAWWSWSTPQPTDSEPP